ncbi:Nif11 family protein [Nitrospirillum sp. BR 11828]|uniref:Nif11 family protein n=1 Tax=Nitrospirillum sp. BR 11828 TaxID=3104325 RepID=UPI002ACA6672|nr:Nif11 family protein [Nitrospirillum sp. BR 11828]MDZ5650734.1 Nif11 family protein [Nitrospirillum sp. BR 11828]
MSQTEVDRLLADIQANPQILDALPGLGDAAGIIAYANAHGYAITAADVQAYLDAHPEGEATDATLTGASAARKHHSAVASHSKVAVGIAAAGGAIGAVVNAAVGAAAIDVATAAAVDGLISTALAAAAAVGVAGAAATTTVTVAAVA